MRVLKRAVLLGGLALAGVGGQASAATTVGETFLPPPSPICAGGETGVTYIVTASPGNQYQPPETGVITSWSYRAGSAPFSQMQLKLASQQPGKLVMFNESEIETPAANTLNTFRTQIPIPPEVGLSLGFWALAPPGNADCLRFGLGYELVAATGNVHPFQQGNWIPGDPNTQADVSAVVEPDADNDGFGDESQDTCLPPTVQTDCDPPETTIKKAPEKKTAKRRARFKFTSDEPGSTFECKLNKRKFKPCESPFRKRVRTGREHKFKVRATDAGGNVDPSPAKHRFSVLA